MGVWGTDEWMIKDSKNLDNIRIVLNAYRSIRERVTYASVPITSGEHYYSQLEKNGVKSIDDVVDSKDFMKNVMAHNAKEGILFADEIAKESRRPVISPCAFEARTQKWSENDYMYLWFRLIEEKAKKLVMKKGWEYSNGASREFVRAMEMQFGFIKPGNTLSGLPDDVNIDEEYYRMRQINVYTPKWNYLYINDGIKLLSHSINNLNKRGFDVPTLEQSLAKLWCVCIYAYKNLQKKGEKMPYSYTIDWNDDLIKKQIHQACKRYQTIFKKIGEEKWYF